jgi:hypothetical protein
LRCSIDAGAAPPVDEQPWLLQNVVDRSLMGRAVQRVLDGSSTKIGLPSLSIVSNAVQKHLKNVLEAAFKVAKSRVNKTAFNSYEGKCGSFITAIRRLFSLNLVRALLQKYLIFLL